MRRAARRDDNESELVAVAEQLGALWVQTGPLDGWICWREHWYPVEIKNGNNKYTDAQILFLARCKAHGATVWTWRTADDVLRTFGARRSA